MQPYALVILLGLGGLLFSSCGSPAGNTNTANSNANTPFNRSAGPPDRAALISAENSAYEAWKNKNGNFFEEFLTTGFVTFGTQGRQDKAAAIKGIVEANCQINSYALSDEAITVMGSDGAVLTFQAAKDGTCDGQAIPGRFWAATIYLRDGEKWKAAYHNEVPVRDTNTSSTPAASAPAASPVPPGTAETPVDNFTKELVAAETKAWEGRKARNLRSIADVTMFDLIYIDAGGSGRLKREEAAKLWTSPECSIRSFSITEPLGRPIAANAALLTYKATIDGSCGTGSAKSIWGSTVYMKEGGNWKAFMIFNRPA